MVTQQRPMPRPYRLPIVVLWLVAVSLVGCASSATPAASTSPGATTSPTGTTSPTSGPTATPSAPGATASPVRTESPTAGPGAGQILACGSDGPTFPSSALNTSGAETGADPAAAALRLAIKEETVPEVPLPSSGWRRVAESASDVLFVAPGTELVPWMQVQVRASASGWKADAWGECRLQVAVPADVLLAVWSLDPAWPLTAGSRELHVLLVEGGCGASLESRILAPVIVYRSDSVLITVTVRRLPGPQDAVGCDPVPTTIQLSEPLGGRNLYDSGRFPPKLVLP